MAGPYRYVIGPVVEHAAGVMSYYGAPESCVSWIDLRRMSEQSSLGQVGCGFFTMPSGWSIPSGYHWLGGGEGDCRSLYLTAQDQTAWLSLIGVNPTRTASTTLLDALDETLTTLADPTGDSAPKPIVPGTGDGPPPSADIILGGHSVVRRKELVVGGGWWKKLVALHQRELDDDAARDPHDRLWRKRLGDLSRKYFGSHDDVRANQLVSQQLKRDRAPSNPGARQADRVFARKPETSYTDDFTRANAVTLGAGWTSFFSGSGEAGIASNMAYVGKAGAFGSGAPESCRYDSDLSSADHACQLTGVSYVGFGSSSAWFGPCARFSSSAETCYTYGPTCRNTSASRILDKIVFGTRTNLASASATNADGVAYKLTPNGSAIAGTAAGVADLAVTDTAISSGVRGGLSYVSTNSGVIAYLDGWGVEDLVAAVDRNGGINRLLMGVG